VRKKEREHVIIAICCSTLLYPYFRLFFYSNIFFAVGFSANIYGQLVSVSVGRLPGRRPAFYADFVRPAGLS
jgi:hypothetical protein